jgi:hypothetical protein
VIRSLSLLTDEDFQGGVIRGLLRLQPELDIVRVRDVGLGGANDPTILAWAAEHGRVVLTHDRATMPRHAYERVDMGLLMPGVIVVPRWLGYGPAIEQILICTECSREGEWEGQVLHLPL